MYPFLALAAPGAASFTAWEAFEIGALLLLAASTALLWRRMRRPAPLPEAEPDGLPLVVAAAAVAAVIDEPHRIVGIAEVPETSRALPNPWSLEGRRSHFASHQLR
jgi:hypothetical protein